MNWLLQSLSGREFMEWMAYAEIEPFGEERADLRMAILAALIANVHRDPEKTKPFGPEDFMPRFDGAGRKEVPALDKAQAIAAIRSYFLAMVKASGGQDLRTQHTTPSPS